MAQEKAAEFLQVITAKTAEAEKVKNEVLAVKEQMAGEVDRIGAEKAIVEKDLEEAKPALEEAIRALDQIKPADIQNIKKLRKPPNLIMRILDGVLLLKHALLNPVTVDPEQKDFRIMPSWASAVKTMSESNFLKTLLEFPKDQINDETIDLLQPYLDMPDFNTEAARKSSGSISGLCSWVRAMVTYRAISKEVLPKKEALDKAQHKLDIAMGELALAQADLDSKQKLLDEMKAEYDEAMNNKRLLQEDAELTVRKANSATALINGLGGEKKRWTKQSKEFADIIRRLVGDVAVASAFLCYGGPFNQEFRTILSEKFRTDLAMRKVPYTSDLNLTRFLADEATVGEWNLQGLPTDELSTQNGIIVTNSTRYPLLVDPQSQGRIWIKNREGSNNLRVTNLNDKHFRQHLEDCLSFGYPLLIEDIENELDPLLDNVLEKNIIKQGRSHKVKIGDKEVDFSSSFFLYMTTNLSNPSYTPEIFAKTSVVDFAVTMTGLEDQLLGRVILKEKMELEKQRQQLLAEVNANKKKMKELEDSLLLRLTTTKGSLVDDVELIDVLNNSKVTANEVQEKLQNATDTEKMINSAREEFRPVATRGSILYFLIVEMGMVNHMYATSLSQFLQVFDHAIDVAEQSPLPPKRLSNIISSVTIKVYSYVIRGLYEEHKFLFAWQLALKVQLEAKRITFKEYRNLIRGGAALDLNTVRKKPFAWIPDASWLNLVALSELPTFQDILDHIRWVTSCLRWIA